jgi:FG-GAP repeat
MKAIIIVIISAMMFVNAHLVSKPARARLFELEATIIASDAAAEDRFGSSVAISGNRAVIGAMGAHNDIAGFRSGAAYVFDVSTGGQLAKFAASDAAETDRFGSSVSISRDWVLVGAPGKSDAGISSGAAYLFEVATATQLAKLTANDAAQFDSFGSSVAISVNNAIVGAPLDSDAGPWSGAAYLFDVVTGNQLAKFTACGIMAGAQFGSSVAISGNMALIGAVRDDAAGRDSGSAYLFDVITRSQIAKLVASDAVPYDYFGASVAISGNTALVGAPSRRFDVPGSAYLFDIATGNQLGKLTASDAAADDQFGRSVAITGNWALVGAPGGNSGAGSVYLFDLTTQSQLAILTASDARRTDMFGNSVAFNGSAALVGAPPDSNEVFRSGSAYLFHKGAVPEPNSPLLAAFASLALLILRRRAMGGRAMRTFFSEQRPSNGTFYFS